jgi:hypothetical protein
VAADGVAGREPDVLPPSELADRELVPAGLEAPERLPPGGRSTSRCPAMI